MNARAVMRAVQAVRDAMDEFERTEDVSVLIAAQERARRVLAHVKDPVRRRPRNDEDESRDLGYHYFFSSLM